MTVSTDEQILAYKQEYQEIADRLELGGNENWQIRLREAFQRIADELQAIHEKAGEPELTSNFRLAESQISFAIGYGWAGLAQFAETDTNVDDEFLSARNLLWQAVGQGQMAVGALVESSA